MLVHLVLFLSFGICECVSLIYVCSVSRIQIFSCLCCDGSDALMSLLLCVCVVLLFMPVTAWTMSCQSSRAGPGTARIELENRLATLAPISSIEGHTRKLCLAFVNFPLPLSESCVHVCVLCPRSWDALPDVHSGFFFFFSRRLILVPGVFLNTWREFLLASKCLKSLAKHWIRLWTRESKTFIQPFWYGA